MIRAILAAVTIGLAGVSAPAAATPPDYQFCADVERELRHIQSGVEVFNCYALAAIGPGQCVYLYRGWTVQGIAAINQATYLWPFEAAVAVLVAAVVNYCPELSWVFQRDLPTTMA